MRYQLVCAAVVGLVLCVIPVFAQGPQPSTEGWKFQVVPYLWGPSIDGRTGINDHDVDLDAGFNNVLDHLHFAFMSAGEAVWNNRFVVGSDAVYSDLRGHHATTGPLFSEVVPMQKMWLVTPEGGVRFFDDSHGTADVLAGIRYWHLDSELHFQSGQVPGLDLEGKRSWVDGILGVRGKAYLPKRLFVTGYGDLGGGGSNFTYQWIATGGGDLDEHFSLIFGYRYLNVNYNKDRFLFDTSLKGPLFGVIIKFW